MEKTCEDGTEFISQAKNPIEKEFAIIEKYLTYGLFHSNRGRGKVLASRFSVAVQVFAVTLAIYCILYAIHTMSTRDTNVLTTVILLIIICNSIVAASGCISLMLWLKYDKLQSLFRRLHSVNKSRGVKKSREFLRRMNCRFIAITNFKITFAVFSIVYFASEVMPDDIELEDIFGILYFEKLIIVVHITQMYLFIGLSLQLHIYAFCLEATTMEIRYFMAEANISKDFSNEPEAITFFTQSIEKSARLFNTVRYLNNTFMRFVFFQVSMIIPVLLFMTYLAITQRNAPLAELVPTVVMVALCMSGFYILTVYPARLHNQIKKTRVIFSSNIRHWISFGPRVHTAALVFSAHLEQQDLGVTLWGFALLSKRLILTSLSAMATALALFLQFSDCKYRLDPASLNSTIDLNPSLIDIIADLEE